MSFDIDREQRTRAFQKVGILGCGHILDAKGIHHPSDQMTVVHGFLTRDLALSHLHHRPEQWVEAGLDEAAHGWQAGDWSVAWTRVMDPSTCPVRWFPEREFGNLLNVRFGGKAVLSAANRLRSRGIPVNWTTLVDLRDDFMHVHLPRAVHSFDPERGLGRETFWLSTLFYRYALRAIRSDHARREQLGLVMPMRSAGVTPEEALLESERDGLAAAVLDAMAHLSSEQRLAIEMYFGMEDREWTLQEIGQAVGTTRFKARSLIVLGLTHLALASGVGDRLGADEQVFARKLFDEGMPPAKAAREMGVSAEEMGNRLAAAFGTALRARTVGFPSVRNHAKGVSMNQIAAIRTWPEAAADTRLRASSTADGYINAYLRDLKEAPRFQEVGDGTLRVEVGGALFDLIRVREAVTDETVDAMVGNGIAIDWLLSGPVAAKEISPFARELEAAQDTRWEIASELLDACEERLGQVIDASSNRDLEVRRVCTVLISLSQALDSELPADALLSGGARLRVATSGAAFDADPAGSAIVAWWDVSPPTKKVGVRDLIRRRCMAAGGLPQVVVDVLPIELSDRLQRAEFVPDGFVYLGSEDGHTMFGRGWLNMEFE